MTVIHSDTGTPLTSTDACQGRSQCFQAKVCDHIGHWFDQTGRWRLPQDGAPTGRERLWLAGALFGQGADAMANALLHHGIQPHHPNLPRFEHTRFDIFNSNIAVLFLRLFSDQMDESVRAELVAIARDGFGNKPGNRQPDYQFHGYNDNMPAKATMGLILGGEYFDEPNAIRYGLWNLRRFADLLYRRGINSEYNSPTYSAVTLHAMAEIAEHSSIDEACDLALKIEHRLWIDLAARFHPETGVVAGPYQRAYTIDLTTGHSLVSMLLWLVLGDLVKPSPMDLFKPKQIERYTLHFKGIIPWMVANFSWFTVGQYHLPASARELMAEKTYPHRAVATFESGDCGPSVPATPGFVSSYLEADYTIGTSSVPGGEGSQTADYFVSYRRSRDTRGIEDVGTVYSQYVLNDECPGDLVHPPVDPASTNNRQDPWAPWARPTLNECVGNESHRQTYEADRAVVRISNPMVTLGQSNGDRLMNGAPAVAQPVSRLSELIVFPSVFGGHDELWVNGRPRDAWTGEVPNGAWVVCRRGRLLIGFRPLVYTVTLGQPVITLETHNGFELIRSTFYQGDPRVFTRDELRQTFGGFVAEHASVDEYDSTEAFARALGQSRVTDYYWYTRRLRYRRPGNHSRKGLDIELSASPGAYAARYVTVNRKPVQPATVDIDGIGITDLPILNEAPRPMPGYFPWDHFENAWYDIPWAINAREIEEE